MTPVLLAFFLAPAKPASPEADAVAETSQEASADAEATASQDVSTSEPAASGAGSGGQPTGAAEAAPPPAAEPAREERARVRSRGAMAPLPPPPPSEDPASIKQGPWRGLFWFAARADLTVPLGGSRPARGTAVAGGGTAEFGVRLHNAFGLRTGIGFTVHDADQIVVEDIYGNRFTTLDYGQLTSFELLGVRGFLPVKGRFQPYLDAAGGVALYLPPGEGDNQVGGLFRGALGFDGWVSPHVALGMDAAYRAVGLADSVGHALVLSGHLSVHF